MSLNIPSIGTLSFDNHEILVQPLERVHLNGLEQVVRSVGHGYCRGGAEATGEVANGLLSAVDLAVVAGKEEVHVLHALSVSEAQAWVLGRKAYLTITDQSLINRPRATSRDRPTKQRLRSTPPIRIRRVRARLVRECSRSPLVREDPDALGRKVEDGRRDSGATHDVLSSGAHVGREVGERGEHHGAVGGAGVVCRGVDEVLAIIGDVSEVFESGEAGLWRCEGAGGRPFVGCRKSGFFC
jgi:hypothetical protein